MKHKVYDQIQRHITSYLPEDIICTLFVVGSSLIQGCNPVDIDIIIVCDKEEIKNLREAFNGQAMTKLGDLPFDLLFFPRESLCLNLPFESHYYLAKHCLLTRRKLVYGPDLDIKENSFDSYSFHLKYLYFNLLKLIISLKESNFRAVSLMLKRITPSIFSLLNPLGDSYIEKKELIQLGQLERQELNRFGENYLKCSLLEQGLLEKYLTRTQGEFNKLFTDLMPFLLENKTKLRYAKNEEITLSTYLRRIDGKTTDNLEQEIDKTLRKVNFLDLLRKEGKNE